MAIDKAKFLMRFIEEAREHINSLNDGLLNLEMNPDDSDTLNTIFRSAHTIKGSSKMMRLNAISDVAHKLEDAFDAIRSKKIKCTQQVSNYLFDGVDFISNLLDDVSAGKTELKVDQAIIDKLNSVLNKENKQSEEKLELKTETKPKSDEAKKQSPNILKSETIRINADKLDKLITNMGEINSSYARIKNKVDDIIKLEKKSQKIIESISSTKNDQSNSENLNIILSENLKSFYFELKDIDKNLKNEFNSHDLLIKELQKRALDTRMMPLSTIFDSFKRTVRDMSNSLGKPIDFIIEGGDTEIDKKVIEKLGDPLLHMIRNSIGHGIESPEVRVKSGKSKSGTIKLSAYYETGSAVIELIDDGSGISINKIKEKALKKKLLTEQKLNKMSHNELINLIFLPGFSTNQIITDLSGRGVGMDVVKKNIIDELKGTISVDTEEGKLTTFTLKLPLTLAIIKLLSFNVSNQIFAIPTNSVSEIIRIKKEDMFDVVGKKAIRHRNQFISIENLSLLLKMPQSENGDGKKELTVIIANSAQENLGFIVDSLLDEIDMEIKPLPKHMKKNMIVSGVTLWSGIKIVNILNVHALIAQAKKTVDIIKTKATTTQKQHKILVVDDSISTREIEKSILESYGYKVDIAEDGIKAIELTRRNMYDIIITDVEMPRMDGFTLTETLRKNDKYKDIPIIIVTSREKEEDKKRGITVGADAYIVKGSFEQSALFETVQNLI